jgi:hypothetical protein
MRRDTNHCTRAVSQDPSQGGVVGNPIGRRIASSRICDATAHDEESRHKRTANGPHASSHSSVVLTFANKGIRFSSMP